MNCKSRDYQTNRLSTLTHWWLYRILRRWIVDGFRSNGGKTYRNAHSHAIEVDVKSTKTVWRRHSSCACAWKCGIYAPAALWNHVMAEFGKLTHEVRARNFLLFTSGAWELVPWVCPSLGNHLDVKRSRSFPAITHHRPRPPTDIKQNPKS
jgi:hypothetical protein